MRRYQTGVTGLVLAALLVGLVVSGVSVEALAQPPVTATPAPTTVIAETAVTPGTQTIWDIATTTIGVVIAAATPVIAWFLTNFLIGLAKGVGFAAAEAHRARLQEVITNGLNALPETIRSQMKSDKKVTAGTAVSAFLANYAKEHAPASVEALAKDANSASFDQAVTARANVALNDPKSPTPADITPPEVIGKAPPP